MKHPLCVVLVAPRNPLNIGAAARAMSNFGVSQMRVVDAYDVAFREAKSAVNASHVLEAAREFPTVADAVADCTLVVGTTSIGHRVLEHPLRRLESGGKIISRKLASAPVALLFGSEKFGLSNEDMAHCHWLMRIPTREAHESMNLGQAVAVCLYEILRNPAAAKAKPEKKLLAPAEDVERVTQILAEILQHSGYIKERTGESMHLKLRRMLRRMDLNTHDAKLWLGMLRQIQWKLLS
ncbi:MAG: TrmJ/YjtD family RNA methyltransferase [Acidobacteriota bacterium]